MEMDKSALALLCMQRHSWEQGVAMQAFLERRDADAVIALAKEAAYRRLPDGRLAVMDDTDSATDPCSVGEALAWAAKKTRDQDLTRALDGLAHWALEKAPRSEDGIVYHLISAPEFWVDSMYMLPPFLAAIGESEEAMRQMRGYEKALLDPDTGLMAHRWNDKEKRFIRAAHWGVGNGWALAAYARLIRLTPDYQDELTMKVKRLIDALLPYMMSDGQFHDVVDDESTFAETNLSQMLCYTLARGMAEGWLDEGYRDVARQLRSAALSKVDTYGIARGVCGAPHFDRPGVAPEGQAFLMMMETAWERWEGGASKGVM